MFEGQINMQLRAFPEALMIFDSMVELEPNFAEVRLLHVMLMCCVHRHRRGGTVLVGGRMPGCCRNLNCRVP